MHTLKEHLDAEAGYERDCRGLFIQDIILGGSFLRFVGMTIIILPAEKAAGIESPNRWYFPDMPILDMRCWL